MKQKFCKLTTALLLPVFITLLALYLQKGPMSDPWQGMGDNPILILLNWLPIAATFGLGFAVFGNLFWSGSFSALLWGLLSYVNLLKVTARGDPFVPGDVLLLSEGVQAVGSYQLELYPGKLLLVLAVSLGLLLLGFRFRGKTSWKARLAVFLACAAAFTCAMVWAYPSESLYSGLKGPTYSNVPARFERFGFPYCFLHNFNLYPVDKPEGYSEAQAETYDDTYGAAYQAPEVAPNILMVMCEAFSDLPNLEVFTYSQEDNPIAPYNRLAADPRTLSGHLVVSNTGAGTANTEFDVLTGMMTNKLSPATSSAFRVVRRDTPSVPRALASQGYSTFFLHPGQSWFYNRESVYAYLGIADQVFEEAFTDSQRKGSWITDQAFLQVLEESLEERRGAPLFTYAVTIQNHQAYTYQKYGFQPEAPQTDLSLSQAAVQSLSVYFEGLRDSAAMLEELTRYLDTVDEPYLLVFFGDHQPNLGGGFSVYQELGLPYGKADATGQESLGAYTVPYLIWGNAAYWEENDLQAAGEQAGIRDGDTISSHYLGALTCRLAGFQGIDGYFDYLNELRVDLPVCSVYGNVLSDGSFRDALPQDLEEREALRWKWQYYRLKG